MNNLNSFMYLVWKGMIMTFWRVGRFKRFWNLVLLVLYLGLAYIDVWDDASLSWSDICLRNPK